MDENESQHIVTLEMLYNEVVRSKQELKNCIEASEARTLLEVEELRGKVRKLEEENNSLQSKVENLEREIKKKNLIIFGLKTPRTNLSVELLCEKINNLLNVKISVSDISGFQFLGQAENSPLKIEFQTQATKSFLLRHGRNLKGKNISISSDLTKHQLEERKILTHFLKLEREKNSSKSYIRGNKLYINNTPYTIQDLLQTNTQSTRKTNSAPSTPTPTPSHSRGDLNYGRRQEPGREQTLAPAEKPVHIDPQQKIPEDKTTERKTTEEKSAAQKTTEEPRTTPKSRQRFNNNHLRPTRTRSGSTK